MFNKALDDNTDNWLVFHWFLLSFNAGCINTGGFLTTGRFVSHVTGFATLFGVELSHNEYLDAIEILSVPFFFLLGSFLAGLLIDRPIYKKKKPHFDYVMGLSALCLFIASTGGGWHLFGLANDFKISHVYFLLSLLCLACGLQNGAITSSSGNTIRTTHLTGLTTDIGLGLARLLTFQRQDIRYKKERYANRLRTGSVFSFVLGSAVGSWFFINIGYKAFILSALIASYAAWHGRKFKIAAHKQEAII